LALQHQRGFERRVQTGIHDLLDLHDRDWRHGGDFPRNLKRAWERLPARRNFTDDAHAHRLDGAKHSPGHDQQHRAMATDKTCQLLRASSARQDADLHLGQAEFCALACYNNVGSQRELKPAAKRKSFNRSNQWLWTLHDRAPVFLHISRHDFDRTSLRHLANVGSGGKCNIRAGYDDTAYSMVGAAMRNLISKARAHFEIEGV